MAHVEHQAAYDAAIKRNIMANAAITFEKTHADAGAIREFLSTGKVWDDNGNPMYKDGFVGSLAQSLDTYGKLTEGQIAAVRKSIIDRAAKKLEWANERALKDAKRNHLGTVGEKVTVTLTVMHIIVLDGMYGTNFIHICEDAEGNTIIYKGKASGFPMKGWTATVTAAVKEHGVRDGVKQTIIQRPKIVVAASL